MNTKFIEDLGRYYKVSQMPESSYLFMVENKTPAHAFFTAIKLFDDFVVAFPSRDKIYKEVLLDLVGEVEKTVQHADLSPETYLILPAHLRKSDKSGMEQYCLLGPSFHDTFTVKFPVEQGRTYVVFPVFSCEFSGNEPADIVKLIRKEFVSTLDWERFPACKAIISFENESTGVRSMNAGLAKLETVLNQLSSFGKNDSSLMRIRNYMDSDVVITRNAHGDYLIQDPSVPEVVMTTPKESLKDAIANFLRGRTMGRAA